jgi:hypothetical protein
MLVRGSEPAPDPGRASRFEGADPAAGRSLEGSASVVRSISVGDPTGRSSSGVGAEVSCPPWGPRAVPFCSGKCDGSAELEPLWSERCSWAGAPRRGWSATKASLSRGPRAVSRPRVNSRGQDGSGCGRTSGSAGSMCGPLGCCSAGERAGGHAIGSGGSSLDRPAPLLANAPPPDASSLGNDCLDRASLEPPAAGEEKAAALPDSETAWSNAAAACSFPAAASHPRWPTVSSVTVSKAAWLVSGAACAVRSCGRSVVGADDSVDAASAGLGSIGPSGAVTRVSEGSGSLFEASPPVARLDLTAPTPLLPGPLPPGRSSPDLRLRDRPVPDPPSSLPSVVMVWPCWATAPVGKPRAAGSLAPWVVPCSDDPSGGRTSPPGRGAEGSDGCCSGRSAVSELAPGKPFSGPDRADSGSVRPVGAGGEPISGPGSTYTIPVSISSGPRVSRWIGSAPVSKDVVLGLGGTSAPEGGCPAWLPAPCVGCLSRT